MFLKEYDAKEKVKRGVFYTPLPVVSFIVRSVDELLKTEFGLEDGLADITTWGELQKKKPEIELPKHAKPETPFVQILDFATGTGTFMVQVIETIHKTMTEKWKKLGLREGEIAHNWEEYVPKHLLPRLYGFELMMAPYAIAHMKIGLKLYETGYRFHTEERVRLYLTNTLEEPKDFSSQIELFAPALAHEAKAANRVKRDVAVTVVIGNPPYSYMSGNMTVEAKRLIEPFRFVDGAKIKEKNALILERALQDDFIKFLAYSLAQMIKSNSNGVSGFITNSSYLDSTFLRGFRNYLINNVQLLHFVNLFGDSIKDKEENVFDIEQGVSLFLCVGRTKKPNVLLSELHGSRVDKYKYLETYSVTGIPNSVITPFKPNFYFSSIGTSKESQDYFTFESINDIFRISSNGIKTNRDSLVIGFSDREVRENLDFFMDSKNSDKTVSDYLGVSDNSQWSLSKNRKVCANTYSKKNFETLAYRPFDLRRIYYHDSVVFNPRPAVMQPLLHANNLALLVNRKIRTETHAHFFIVDGICMAEYLSSADNCNVYPIFVYESELFSHDIKYIPNYKNDFLGLVSEILSITPADKDLFARELSHYIYAIFHSRQYRKIYEDLLKTDYPRIPLPAQISFFRALQNIGADLAALHLLSVEYPFASWNLATGTKSHIFNKFVSSFKGTFKDVAKGYPTYESGTVFINPNESGFKGVPEVVWNFHIGGYQVCEKWLKDRRGRTLTDDDIEHYQKIIVAIKETIRLMGEIDKVIEEHGGFPGAFVTDPKIIEEAKAKVKTASPF